jgi:hypothetical protein
MSWIFRSLAFLLAIIAINPNLDILGIKAIYIINAVLIILVLTRPLRFNGKLSGLLALLAFSAIFAWSIGGGERTELMFSYIGNLITLFLLSGLKNLESFLSSLFFNISLPFFIFGAYLIFYWLSDPSEVESFYMIASEGIRLSGFYDNPNVFGGLVLISNIGLLSVFKDKTRLFLFTGILLHIVVAFMTQSRSLMVVIVLYNIVYSLLNNRQLLWYLGGLVLFSFSLLVNIDFGRLQGIFNLGESFTSERSFIVDAGFETISRFPLGIGFREQHVVIGGVTGIYKTTHNSFIADLLRFGWVFGSLWLIFWLIPLAHLIRWRRLAEPIKMFVIGYALFLVMSTAHALTNWWVFWWLTLLLYGSFGQKAQLE